MDYILNGQAHGSTAAMLLQNNMDPNCLRPWMGEDGRSYITVNKRGAGPMSVPLLNTAATLRKDEWIQLDQTVIQAAKERLRIVSDIRGAGLTYSIPNAMGKTVLETQTMGDITPATISMDPAREGESDRPEFDLAAMPLPIIHKDFFFTAREIAVSRNSGAPLDTTMVALASRRVAEQAEQLTVGTAAAFTYGGGTVYGFVNFPQRITKVLTAPDDSAWTPATTVEEVLAMRQLSTNQNYRGPWMLYNSPAWDEYFDDDYSSVKGDNTLRERLRRIAGITDIRTADYLEDYDLVLIQMTSDVVRMVVGMEITTLQWESKGGMQLNFKVMAMMVPQLRSVETGSGTAGIVHGAPA